jgi:hypothetical protein
MADGLPRPVSVRFLFCALGLAMATWDVDHTAIGGCEMSS